MREAGDPQEGLRHDQGEVDSEEFVDVAQSPAEARLLRKALKQLSEGGAGSTLQEMAQEVLSGRTGLREAVSHGVYGEELISRCSAFKTEWESMSEMERERKAEEGRKLIEDEQREMEAEQRQAGVKKGKHSGAGWSAY